MQISPRRRFDLLAGVRPEIAVVEIEQQLQPERLGFGCHAQGRRQIVVAAADRFAAPRHQATTLVDVRDIHRVVPQAQAHPVGAAIAQQRQQFARLSSLVAKHRAGAFELIQHRHIDATDRDCGRWCRLTGHRVLVQCPGGASRQERQRNQQHRQSVCHVNVPCAIRRPCRSGRPGTRVLKGRRRPGAVTRDARRGSPQVRAAVGANMPVATTHSIRARVAPATDGGTTSGQGPDPQPDGFIL